MKKWKKLYILFVTGAAMMMGFAGCSYYKEHAKPTNEYERIKEGLEKNDSTEEDENDVFEDTE